MPPSNIRRFERKPFLRMKTMAPGNNSLDRLAFAARNRGYNARIVKNKTSHSLYIRPRTYNMPIPEVDPSRIATFPTALAMSGRTMGTTVLGRQIGKAKNPMDPSRNQSLDANPTEVADYIKQVYSENKSQIDGQQQEIEDWLQTYAEQESKLKDLEKQSSYNLEMNENNKGYSNLTESQWGLIQSEPKIASLLSSTKMNNVLEKTAIKGLLDIMSKDIQYSDKLGFTETSNEVILVQNENGQMLDVARYPTEFFNKYFDEVKTRVLEEWRKDFIDYLRSEDQTEHSLLASMIRKDSLEDIQYWKWPGYDRDVVKQLIKQETNLDASSNGITLSINIDEKALESFLARIGVQEIINKINRTYERKYFTEPRKTFSHGNETRQRIANYLWERKVTGDDIISTDDIQTHLSKNMKKPPVTRQTSKFLQQDPRFTGAGKLKKVRLWKLSGDHN